MPYNPSRQAVPAPPENAIEIDLVSNVNACGTCAFFWPDDPSAQPYGPYPSYDFDGNFPNLVSGSPPEAPWVQATTQAPCFPNAEILAGCRKAPIMTIGINPNLTAFAPGQMGAAWCYPSFSATGNGDASAKYAWYSRHRSIYQERFDLSFIRQYLLTTGQIIAPNPGVILGAARASDAPHFTITVRYDGDSAEQELPIVENTGEPRYVLLFDTQAPNNRFAKGDVIAARLDVPPGRMCRCTGNRWGITSNSSPCCNCSQAIWPRRWTCKWAKTCANSTWWPARHPVGIPNSWAVSGVGINAHPQLRRAKRMGD